MNRAMLLLSRALRLRCPACGGESVFVSWFTMRDDCPTCGLHFERNEGYFTGAMAVNLIIAELIFAVGLGLSFYVMYPALPGRWIYGWILVMVLGPILLYPFSKSIWLAFDLIVRPVTDNQDSRPPLDLPKQT